MMSRYDRREFLADVGRGMLVASVGPALAQDLGLASAALAGEGAERLTFGPMEPLVSLMQETPVDRLLPAVVERIKAGTDLRQLVAAAALANARTLRRPGLRRLPRDHGPGAVLPHGVRAARVAAALPVLKVLYRNTNHIQQMGGRSHEALHPVEPAAAAAGTGAGSPARGDPPAGHGGGRADLRRDRPRAARRGLQRPPVRRPGLHRRPSRRARLAILGPARLHRQGARPHPAPPVGAVLRGRGARAPPAQDRRRGGAAGAPAQAARPPGPGEPIARAIAGRTTPGSSG